MPTIYSFRAVNHTVCTVYISYLMSGVSVSYRAHNVACFEILRNCALLLHSLYTSIATYISPSSARTLGSLHRFSVCRRFTHDVSSIFFVVLLYFRMRSTPFPGCFFATSAASSSIVMSSGTPLMTPV
jgi:hypothetical protein